MSSKAINILLVTGVLASAVMLVQNTKQKVKYNTPLLSPIGTVAVIGGGMGCLIFLKKRQVI